VYKKKKKNFGFLPHDARDNGDTARNPHAAGVSCTVEKATGDTAKKTRMLLAFLTWP
jgi:hypothetical protein